MQPDEKGYPTPPLESECDWGTGAEVENKDLDGKDAVLEGGDA